MAGRQRTPVWRRGQRQSSLTLRATTCLYGEMIPNLFQLWVNFGHRQTIEGGEGGPTGTDHASAVTTDTTVTFTGTRRAARLGGRTAPTSDEHRGNPQRRGANCTLDRLGHLGRRHARRWRGADDTVRWRGTGNDYDLGFRGATACFGGAGGRCHQHARTSPGNGRARRGLMGPPASAVLTRPIPVRLQRP